MARIGTAYVDVKGDFTQLNRGIAGVSSKLKTAFGVGAAAGLAGAIAGVTKVTVDFDKSMRNVNSIAQLNDKQYKKLSKSVLGLAGKTAQAPKTLAEGLYDLVSSGFDANQSLSILGASAKAATAGLTTTEVSTKAVAAVLNAYHRPASDAAQISDELFQTVNKGVITFDELASNIGDVLPFASSLGVNLSGVGAAISTMTKAGISAPETMTRIKSIMQSLIAPSDALQHALDRVGVKGADALIKKFGGGRAGLQGALEAIIKTTDGSKEALAKLFPNVRALGGALALTGKNARGANADLDAFKKVTGATDTALKEQSKSVAFQFNKLKATVSAIAISIGSTAIPTVTKALLGLTQFLTDHQADFSRFGDEVKKVFGDIKALIVPVVTALKGAFDSLSPALQKVITAYAAATVASGLMYLAFGEVGIVITGIVAAAILIHRNWDTIGPVFDRVRVAISGWTKQAAADIQPLIKGITVAAQVAKALLVPAFNLAFSIAKRVWPGIKQVVVGTLQIIQGIVRTFVALLHGDWGRAWSGLKTTVSGALKVVVGTVRVYTAALRETAARLGQAIASGFRAAIGGIRSAVTEAGRGAVEVLHNLGSRFFELGKNLIQGLINGMGSLKDAVLQKIKDVVLSPYHAAKKFLGIKSPSTLFHELGLNIALGLANGIASGKNAVMAAAKDGLLFPIEAQIAKLEAQRDALQASFDKADTRRQRHDLQDAIKQAKAEAKAQVAESKVAIAASGGSGGGGGSQSTIVKTIVAVGKQMGATAKQMKAAIEAGIVESGLKNLKGGDKDSAGVFQQRPSQGWTGLTNVSKAAQEFFAAAKGADHKGLSAGQLAQAVQRSALPGKYDAVSAQAQAILGGVKGLKVKGGDGSSIADAIKAYKDFEREQVRIKKLAAPEIKIKGLRQLQAWRDALSGIASDLKGKVSDAVDDFQQKWEDTIGKQLDKANSDALDAFDKATEAAIANGPAAQRLAQLQAEADRIARDAEDASNQKALKQALNSGTKADVAAAQAAIDETARQRAIAQAQVDAQAEQESIQAQRDAQRVALEDQQAVDRQKRLDADTLAFKTKLQTDLEAEQQQLEDRKQNYARFVTDVNKLLLGLGIPGLDVNYDTETAINAGPGKKKVKKRAAGGGLSAGDWSWVGERGPELIRMGSDARVYSHSDSQRMSGGGGVVVQGDLVVQDASDADRLARQLAWKIATAAA